jgi:hypothetical protein
MELAIIDDGRAVSCVRCDNLLLYNSFEVWEHYRFHHLHHAIFCYHCNQTGGGTVWAGAPDTQIPFQSWYPYNVYRHLERHLPGNPPLPPHQEAHVPIVKLSHSSDYKSVSQEFYELAAMREQSLRDMALDLLEEEFFEKWAGSSTDWQQYQIWMEERLRARGHTMKKLSDDIRRT